jgi:hypothetical protein
MRWPTDQRVNAAVQALERIVASSESVPRKMMLCECVQAYAPLEPHQRVELSDLVQNSQSKEINTMKTWFETARDEGRLEERRLSLRTLLEERFGQPLAPSVLATLEQMTINELTDRFQRGFRAASLKELGFN